MKDPRYRALLAETVWRRNLWMVLALTLAAGNAALAYWVLRTDVREKTIVVPPVFDRPFWVHGEQVSVDYLEQMAVFFASLALTFNPDNIEHQAQLFLRYADPARYGALAAQLDDDVRKVKRNRVSSVFYAQRIRVQGHAAALNGQLTTLVGQQATTPRQATFRLRFIYRDGRLFVTHFTEVQDHANPFAVAGGGSALQP